MGLLGILRDKLKASNENKVIEDDTKLYTDVVYNTFANLIILISYSNDYANQVVEFLDACNTAGIKFITMSSSYGTTNEEENDDNDEEEKEKEFAIRPEQILHQRQYIVLSGSVLNYAGIYSCIDALSNDILLAIQDDIYNHCSSTYFNEHIKNGVLNFNEFKYKKISPQYDRELTLSPIQYDKQLVFNDPKLIISKIPSGFMEKDILQIIKIHTPGDDYAIKSMLRLLKEQYDKNKCGKDFMKDFADIYSMIIGEINDEKIHRLLFVPKYMLQDSDTLIGDVDDERLDEMFRQRYDKFSGIATDGIEYKDIDEIIQDDGGDGKDG